MHSLYYWKAGDTPFTIAQVKAANKAAGHHWFDKNTLRFFSSRIGRTLYCGRYFVTSERQGWEKHSRAYTIRQAQYDGSVTTVGEMGQYTTSRQAVAAIRKLQKVA